MAKPQPGSRPIRRPRLIFGPGLMIALVLSFYIAYQRGLFTKPGPPIVEHAPAPGPAQPPAADIEFLLDRSDELALTDAQVQRLRDLSRQWEASTADQRAAADRAAREFDAFMKQTSKSGKPAALEEIQRRAATVSELSAALAQARRSYWQRALLVLEPDQRTKAEQALREHLEPPPAPSRKRA
jgi:hypothetical protein